ncbi:hypothetical protein [Pseudomonas putida]|uniref:Uncharacterized protein n=1 Tax=Pseudomonas putida TaxID=303 RepID=A0A1B2F5X4_PSEPU|nr:hypothetical protein [Pseudomonas putida]ANY87672.1 hypothetical protein IEC33019_2115 [Pseudomonas putida]
MTIDKDNLKALAWRTEDHLTDKSATTYDAEVAARWAEKGWPVDPLFDQGQVDALLVEIERLEQYAELEAKGSDAAAQDLIRLVRENRQLKAEIEAVRAEAKRQEDGLKEMLRRQNKRICALEGKHYD